MLQSQALDIIKTGVNVFLTGEPGAGKTHTINEYIKYLRDHNIEPAVTAATGIAATHLGGSTIHSWSGIGIKEKLDRYTLSEIVNSKYVKDKIIKAKILIIDEISMLSANTLDMVELVCLKARQNEHPFGGLQVILVGDFFQLPPIVRTPTYEKQQTISIAENNSPFAYNSSAWERANFKICYLTEQYRQDDSIFLEILSAIRHNNFNDEFLAHIKTRKTESHKLPDKVTKLFSHNIDVDRVNENMLTKLVGIEKTFKMHNYGRTKLVEVLKKGCLSPEKLRLKIGATVMFTKNNARAGFVNGTLGTVISFEKGTDYPIIKTHLGDTIRAEPVEWKLEEDGETSAQIIQVPLRLAWAITVHKSQGMSLDAAIMDLSSVFEYGQGYVALSRVRRLSGLYLLGWNEKVFQVHPEVLKKDIIFRTDSEALINELDNLNANEIIERQNNFISACGGKNLIKKTIKKNKLTNDKKYDVKTIREKHSSAYLPWDEEQEKKLLTLFEQKLKTAKIAAELGRNSGAIRARLKKLGKI